MTTKDFKAFADMLYNLRPYGTINGFCITDNINENYFFVPAKNMSFLLRFPDEDQDDLEVQIETEGTEAVLQNVSKDSGI